MAQMTITEALAELKTIGKRMEKKREFVLNNLYRQDMVKDPLEKDGGTFRVIAGERQAIADLEERTIRIRAAIAEANRDNSISIEGTTRTIADWLSWRRDVAAGQGEFIKNIVNACVAMRDKAMKSGLQVNPSGETVRPVDIVLNVDERALSQEGERMVGILGALDGQLSLKNATIVVTVAD